MKITIKLPEWALNELQKVKRECAYCAGVSPKEVSNSWAIQHLLANFENHQKKLDFFIKVVELVEMEKRK